jgi:hypothetical protein
MLARPHRLLGEHEFRGVMASRVRWSTPDCAIHVRCNPAASLGMLGFVVGRKALRRASFFSSELKMSLRTGACETWGSMPGWEGSSAGIPAKMDSAKDCMAQRSGKTIFGG